MYSIIRYSLAATAVLSMAQGVAAHPTAGQLKEGKGQQQQQNNRIERPDPVRGGGRAGPEAGAGAGAAKVANAKALYFLTNDEENAVAAIEVGADGLITGNGAVHKTGGKGANGIDGATNEKAAPDALFSQSALAVAGKHIFAVNAGSNTLSMFAIDPQNPLALQKVGEDLQLPGEFPNTVAASEKNGLVCVGMTGQQAGVACADFSPEGLGQVDALRGFQLNQTTPPVGPTNTVSQVFWSADESHLLATVKGDPEKGNNGFFSAYAVLQTDVEDNAAQNQENLLGNNGDNNLNASEAVFGNQNQNQDQNQTQNQNLQQVKAGKAEQVNNKSQNLNGTEAAQANQNNNQNQNQNQNLQQVEAGKAEAEARQRQNLYKNQNVTDPAAAAEAAGFLESQPQEAQAQQQQQQKEGKADQGNQNNQVKAGKFRVSQEEIRSTPEGTAVLFGSVAIPGSQDVLATDASFGVAVLSQAGGGAGQAKQNQRQDQRQNGNGKGKGKGKGEGKGKGKNQQEQQQQKQQQQKQEQQQQKGQQKQQEQGQLQYQTAARLELPNQKATCWATISPLTNTAFVTDVGRNRIVEVGGGQGAAQGGLNFNIENLNIENLNIGAGALNPQEDLAAGGAQAQAQAQAAENQLQILNEIDLSSVGGADLGLIDLRAAGEFVYALSPGTGVAGPDDAGAEAAINVIHAGTRQFVQNARLAGVGAGKNSMGMAVYV